MDGDVGVMRKRSVILWFLLKKMLNGQDLNVFCGIFVVVVSHRLWPGWP